MNWIERDTREAIRKSKFHLTLLWISGIVFAGFMLWMFSTEPDDDAFLLLFCCMLMPLTLVICLCAYKYKKYKALIVKPTNMYYECVQQRCTNIDNPGDLAKIRLIAQKYGYSVSDAHVGEVFQYCKAWVVGEERMRAEMAEKARLKEIREKECQSANYLARFNDCVGREKRAAYYRERIAEGQKEMREGNANASARDYYEKKANSSIMGGIAQGIAGAGAGLAAYARTEADNAAVDVRNAENHTFYSAVASMKQNQYRSGKGIVDTYTQRLHDLQFKLIDESYTTESVMKLLQFSKTSAVVSETGAVTVKATISIEPLRIYESKPAVADGTVVAILKQNGVRAGAVKLALPTPHGVERVGEITGICCELTDPNAEYTVEFAADRLWVIEA